MAAAVMRAVTFGLAGSDSDTRGRNEGRRSRPGSRQGSRSRSESRPAQMGDKDADGLLNPDNGELGTTLSRSSSRVSFQLREPPPPGILLNGANRNSPLPSPSTSPPSSATYAAPPHASTNDLTRTVSSPGPSTSTSPVRPAHPGRQLSETSSIGPVTPTSGYFPPTVSVASSTPSKPASRHQKRESTIRFAPLPEIRPRSYSTGRNVWLEDAEFDGDQPAGDRHWVRRENAGEEEDDYPFDEEEEEEDGEGEGGKGIKWGSWTEVWGLKRPVDDDALSTTSSVGGDGTPYGGYGHGLERTTSSTSSNGASGGIVAGSGGTGGGSSSTPSKKLLKALGLGALSGKKSSKFHKRGSSTTSLFSSSAASSSSPTYSNGNGDLSRISSVDSSNTHSTSAAGESLSRRSSIDTAAVPGRPRGSTGIPMRKASTWEAGDMDASRSSAASRRNSSSTGGPVYYASPSRTQRRRSNYPPVAQRRGSSGRSVNAARAAWETGIEEPAFSEWGAAGHGSTQSSSGSKRRSSTTTAAAAEEDDDDDGSGLAWLKKRRAEREKKEREHAERMARGEGADETQEDQPSQPSSPVSFSATSTFTVEGDDDPESDWDRSISASAPTSSNMRRHHPLSRNPSSRSGTLDSTTSAASSGTIRPSTPLSTTSSFSTGASTPTRSSSSVAAVAAGGGPGAKSNLTATRPALSVSLEPTTAVAAAGSTSSLSESLSTAEGSASPVSDESRMSANESREQEEDQRQSSESESEEEEEEGENDEEDDLDEEELAREEALAEEAKRGAKGLGAERYHSASHQNSLRQVSGAKGGNPSPKLA
ncbi:hypothetical protein JCM11641_000228 [Rhodosporidiobolus odoratus]